MVWLQSCFVPEVGSGEFTRIGTTLRLVTYANKFAIEFHSLVALPFINTNFAYIESIRNTAANLCNDLLKEIRGTQLNYNPGKIC